ncbi:hypothetical protein VTO42DRAFT_3707 [Malbranchea cinnamomea]
MASVLAVMGPWSRSQVILRHLLLRVAALHERLPRSTTLYIMHSLLRNTPKWVVHTNYECNASLPHKRWL